MCLGLRLSGQGGADPFLRYFRMWAGATVTARSRVREVGARLFQKSYLKDLRARQVFGRVASTKDDYTGLKPHCEK